MLKFQEELATTENKVAFARQAFNDAVLGYNNAREVFPGNLLASWFHFDASEYLEIGAETMRDAPTVSFSG